MTAAAIESTNNATDDAHTLMPAAVSVPLTPETVIVHPLVLLSTVDHYNRVFGNTTQRGHRRVLGVLLGFWQGRLCHVTNSYALPFEEDERDPSVWFLDHSYHETMAQLARKVNAKEQPVGWYHTGPKLRANDLSIHERFQKMGLGACPVLVVVDVQPDSQGMPTDAYYATEQVHHDGTSKTFAHCASAIEAEEAEEIGVEHLLRDLQEHALLTSATSLSQRVGEQQSALRGLRQQLDALVQYLDDVLDEKLPLHHPIVYHLQDMLNLLPSLAGGISDPRTQKAFAVTQNDGLLAVYLASLVRAVAALHDLIDNQLANREHERLLDPAPTPTAVDEKKPETAVH